MKIGIIVNKRNVDGTIVLLPTIQGITDIMTGSKVKIGYSEKFSKEFNLLEFRSQKNKYFIKLESINTPEQVDELKEQAVFTDKDNLVFEDDFQEILFYNYEVINTHDNSVIGTVTDYYQLPANDVFVVSAKNNDYLIPNIREVIKEINHNNKYIKIEPIKGLLDD